MDAKKEVSSTVLLVHGTWGRGMLPFKQEAAWTADGSPIRMCYKSKLKSPIDFVNIAWSGGNRMGSRENATKTLIGKIKQIEEDRPASELHLCAHSHAGNIAMMAVKRGNFKNIATICCLSTPFILVRPRDAKLLGSKIYVACGLIMFVLAFLTWITVGSEFFIKGYPREYINAALVILLIPVVPLSIALKNVVISTLNRSKNSIRYLALPRKEMFPTLILRSDGDEAKLALSTVQMLNTIISRIQNVVLLLLPASISDFLGLSKSSNSYYWANNITTALRRKYLVSKWSVRSFVLYLPLSILIFVGAMRITDRLYPDAYLYWETFYILLVMLAILRYVLPILLSLLSILPALVAALVTESRAATECTQASGRMNFFRLLRRTSLS